MNVSEIMAAGQAIVASVGMPNMIKPEVGESSYRFPTDPSTLSSAQLGSLSLRLTGWLSWTNHELGIIDAELGVIKPLFDVLLNKRSRELKVNDPKLTKDESRALLLSGDSSLQSGFKRILTLEFAKTQLEAKTKIYESQLAKLSREQSRREGERQGA